ncbi:hypothetical protein RFI_26936 [Reticulomyxa filosa]|uniref:Uncharacterized protein n=1 Tax=Reticulomyxa filosa TaxID=46433 RepID=X6MAF8_RETFI|nr:hypothetical protein RFI_26936 [Reticulomyxa filosa]|eukprot:ETO10442.1 hypothetical protein RFI_26936 [Reticulomyxa filosa]
MNGLKKQPIQHPIDGTNVICNGIYNASIEVLTKGTKMRTKNFNSDKEGASDVAQLELLSRDGTLWSYIKSGNLSKVQEIVQTDENELDPNERGTFGETILHIALLFRQNEIAKFLVTSFPETIDASYTHEMYQGENALHIAIVNRDYGMRIF